MEVIMFLAQWIKKVIMGGFLWACNRKLIKNAHFFSVTLISYSLWQVIGIKDCLLTQPGNPQISVTIPRGCTPSVVLQHPHGGAINPNYGTF